MRRPPARGSLALSAVLLVGAGVLAAGPVAAAEDEPEPIIPPQVSRQVPDDLRPFVLDLDVQVREDSTPPRVSPAGGR